MTDYRNSTSVQRRNDRMHAMFERARLNQGKTLHVLDYRYARGQFVEIYPTADAARERAHALAANDLFEPLAMSITEAPLFSDAEG